LKERYWENIVKYPESDQEFMEERFLKVNKLLEGLTEKRKEIILLN
jgi:hypothetical protein